MADDLEWIRGQYGVPAEMGGRVIVDGMPGLIIGTSGPHLAIAAGPSPCRSPPWAASGSGCAWTACPSALLRSLWRT